MSMKLKIGSLYTYPNNRAVYTRSRSTSDIIALIEKNQPFVLLELGEELKWVQPLKVLTTDGVVGWITIGYMEDLVEVKHD